MELYKASPQKELFFDSKQSNEMNNIEIQIGSGLFRQQIIDFCSRSGNPQNMGTGTEQL